MISFPNCKINLGLHILEKRADGFHNLETVFYPLPLNDALEMVHSFNNSIEFTHSGLEVDGNIEDNICYKAYQLLKKDFPKLSGVKMHLHKNIPMGAGLGGGSADGAFALMLLNKKFALQIDEEKLIEYALLLGSDCPFFIKNKPAFATGRGERLEEIKLDLSSYEIVLVNPGIHVNTGWAFSKITPSNQRRSVREIIQQPIETWKQDLINDFEAPVFADYAEILSIKENMYQQGAVYAAMSGSGSTVFGIFEKVVNPVFDFPSNYFVKILG